MAYPARFDEIGYWSEVKLDIIKDYAAAYSQVLSAQRDLYHVYIDAFAGGGAHIARRTGKFVPGSPLNALRVHPPFREYHFIELDRRKVAALREVASQRENVHVHEGDCNQILLDNVFPVVRYEDYRRGLCLLDPYGLHLNWEVIRAAGESRSIEIFLNFPIMDMNRNVLWADPERASPEQASRMTAFWGDDSWRKAAYTTTWNLFQYEEKLTNQEIAQAFRQRLRKEAGFVHVPDPVPMRNSSGAVVYYLFFASQKPVAERIVAYIFDKYRQRGAP